MGWTMSSLPLHVTVTPGSPTTGQHTLKTASTKTHSPGRSLAHPGLYSDTLLRSVRWDIGSALDDSQAHCTFLVIPCCLGDPHMKYLCQPEITILAHVDTHSEPPKYYFKPPDHWQGQPKGLL